MPNLQIAAIPGMASARKSSPGRRGPGSLRPHRESFQLQFEAFDWGSDYYKRHGEMMPADGTATLRAFDAIYFGAVGAPIFPITSPYGDCAWPSASPSISMPTSGPRGSCGHRNPLRNVECGDLDWVIVRENSEGEYSGHGGRSHRGLPGETATDVAVYTRAALAASCGSPSTWLVPGRAAI